MALKKRLIFGIILLTAIITAEQAFASYSMVLKKWTKTGRSFSAETMDALLIWDATLISDELLKARQALADKRKFPIENPTYDGVMFYVNLYTHKYLKDFSMEPNSTWRIYLVGADDVEIPPSKIEAVNYDVDDRVLYPHVNPWSKPYMVYFPRTDLGKRPELILRSLVAESHLHWNIK